MQDRYVGDVGDFGKYALLRALTRDAKSDLRLGINWYLFPNESHNDDGRHISYLTREDYRILDPELHRVLADLVRSKLRTVDALSQRPLFKSNTIQYAAPIASLPLTAKAPADRLNDRMNWHLGGLNKLAGASLVFFDPDNGLETPSVPKHSPKSGKFVFWSEIEAFWRVGKSLVIYHHLNRTTPHQTQVDALRRQFLQRLDNPSLLVPLVFRRGSSRVFWVVGQSEHVQSLQNGLTSMLSPQWGQHFTVS